jgi:hypothetical protein
LNCIELDFNSMQLCMKIQFLFFIGWSSLAVCNNLEPKYCLGYEEQCQLSIIIMFPKKMNQWLFWQILLIFLNQKMGKFFAFFFLESIQIILLFYITYLEKKKKKNPWFEQLKYELKNNTWKMMLIENEKYYK